MADISQVIPIQSKNLSVEQCGPAYEIRSYRETDSGVLIDLLNQLSRTGDLSETQIKAFYNSVKDNSHHTIYVLEEGGQVKAAATLLIEPKLLHGAKSVGHIEDVVVDKASRGRGYGKVLIRFLVAMAQQQNCYKVILDCSDNNVGFYKQCGLELLGNEMGVYFE